MRSSGLPGLLCHLHHFQGGCPAVSLSKKKGAVIGSSGGTVPPRHRTVALAPADGGDHLVLVPALDRRITPGHRRTSCHCNSMRPQAAGNRTHLRPTRSAWLAHTDAGTLVFEAATRPRHC